MVARRLMRKWWLALSVVPIVILVGILKYIFHELDLEVLPLSPLMSGLIAANVFLLGFLISGVLVDYKESERLPGDLAASLASMFDEVAVLYRGNKSPEVRDCIQYILDLTTTIQNWFYKKAHTPDVMDKIACLDEYLMSLGELVDDGRIFRIKEEQKSIRRVLIRTRTIRGTYFTPSGYAIAEATNIIVIIGLLISQTNSFFEAAFFPGLIAFLNTYMLLLIRQLDNPFDYHNERRNVHEVSLLPLAEVRQRIEGLVKTWKPLEQVG